MHFPTDSQNLCPKSGTSPDPQAHPAHKGASGELREGQQEGKKANALGANHSPPSSVPPSSWAPPLQSSLRKPALLLGICPIQMWVWMGPGTTPSRPCSGPPLLKPPAQWPPSLMASPSLARSVVSPHPILSVTWSFPTWLHAWPLGTVSPNPS